ncbi:MAG TPA: hypothetical protein VN704_07625 [Verrucomicrobiae bacterium]|nr:hypothetical protein [Verrucomicrobiae bacterium]
MKNISKTIKENRTSLVTFAIIGILASITLILPASLANAKPVPHFATPNGISLSVSTAKHHISLDENNRQVLTSTVTDEFGNPKANVKLAISITTPNGSSSADRTTGPDGTDHLSIPLTDTGDYSASVTATNPNAGGSNAQGSASWTVSK